MNQDDAVVAVFASHTEADDAVRKLASDGFAMKHLSLIGKGYHTEETVSGFYNIGDRVKFWGLTGRLLGRHVGPILRRPVPHHSDRGPRDRSGVI